MLVISQTNRNHVEIPSQACCLSQASLCRSRHRDEEVLVKISELLKHRRLSQQEVFARISRPRCLFSHQRPRIGVCAQTSLTPCRDLDTTGSGLKEEPFQGAPRADPCSQRVAKGGAGLDAMQTLDMVRGERKS